MNPDIEFVPIIVLGLVVYTLTNLAKYLRARDWNGVFTLLSAWIIGVLAVWLVGQTSWGFAVTVGSGETLGTLSLVELLLVGLVVVSAGSVLFDLKKSFDGSDSAATPSLLPSRTTDPSQHH